MRARALTRASGSPGRLALRQGAAEPIDVQMQKLRVMHIDRAVAAVRDVGVLPHDYFAELCCESESESRSRCTTLGWLVFLFIYLYKVM